MNDPRFQKGIELFNRQEFFEAHEVWEDLWREAKKNNSSDENFYRGLIQAAGACHHVKKKNWVGAKGLFESSIQLLKHYETHESEIDLRQLITDFEAAFQSVFQNPQSNAITFPRIR